MIDPPLAENNVFPSLDEEKKNVQHTHVNCELNSRGNWAWWNLVTGFGQPEPLTVISFLLRYSSTSY